MKNWKVILATLLIFVTGMVTGAVTVKRLQSPPRSPGPVQRVEFLRRIERRLDLTPSQRERIDKILSQSQERTAKLWEQIAPKMHEEFASVRKQILDELDSKQQAKFEELLKKSRPRRSPAEPFGRPDREKIEKRGE